MSFGGHAGDMIRTDRDNRVLPHIDRISYYPVKIFSRK